MTSPAAYVAIAVLAALVLALALRTTGMSPLLAALAQLLVVVAAIALIDPLGPKPVIALGIAYYAGFFMGRAFHQEQGRREPAPARRREDKGAGK